MVQMLGFNFGARIPIQTPAQLPRTVQWLPASTYENTGVATDISMREGEPVIVGTLNIGPSGDAIILVVSAKRTNRSKSCYRFFGTRRARSLGPHGPKLLRK
jgi:hypothetical protein